MSRRREEKREQKRELARQLGVAGKDVPTTLLEHERVCEPKLIVKAIDVSVRKRGLLGSLQKKTPLVVVVGLFVVDRHGGKDVARLVRVAVKDVGVCDGGARVDLGVRADVVGDDRVRYRRPGHFVVVVVAAEAAIDVAVLDRVDAAALTDGGFAVVVDGADLVAAAAVVKDAVTTVKDTVAVDVATADGRFAARLTLDVKL